MRLFCALIIVVIWPTALAKASFANGTLALFNTHTGEFETIKYKNTYGMARLNHILRCRLTGTQTDMSLKLIELIDSIEDHFGGQRVEVISGYRSPKLNNSLSSSGHKVARNSLHMSGEAMDIRIPNVPLTMLRDYVKSLKIGGVGYYAGQFVHVDVGRVRYW